MHIADALGKNIIGLFGPVPIYKCMNNNGASIIGRGGNCQPCYNRNGYWDDNCSNSCVNTISPDFVYNIFKSGYRGVII